MGYGIARLAIIPGRAEPAEHSEMVTQLLFGELYRILEVKDEWIQVSADHDDYMCWIHQNQKEEISEETFNVYRNSAPGRVIERSATVSSGSPDSTQHITFGAQLFTNNTWRSEAKTSTNSPALSLEKIEDLGRLFLNTPYLWGGRSPHGIDCSGLSQVIFSTLGINLPRDSSAQANEGQEVASLPEAIQGDLAFFNNDEGKITHVGIVLDGGRIIHASGFVRIDKLDAKGIFRLTTDTYSHNLHSIRRFSQQ